MALLNLGQIEKPGEKGACPICGAPSLTPPFLLHFLYEHNSRLRFSLERSAGAISAGIFQTTRISGELWGLSPGCGGTVIEQQRCGNAGIPGTGNLCQRFSPTASSATLSP